MLRIVGALRQRVIQNLVEALTHQLLTDQISQLMLTILITLDDE